VNNTIESGEKETEREREGQRDRERNRETESKENRKSVHENKLIPEPPIGTH